MKWEGYSEKDSTWEPKDNLNCDKLIENYEKTIGYHRNLPLKKILCADKTLSGELLHLVAFEGCDSPDIVYAKESNELYPQEVIKFYQEKLVFYEK